MPPVGIAPVRGGNEYSGKLTWYASFACIVAAAGGLIFGYDIGISGGVTTMAPFLKKFFPSVYAQQQTQTATSNQYCKYNSQTLTLFTSSLYLAALVSSLGASFVTRKLGRRISMLLGGLIFFLGALINGFAQHRWMLIVGRLLLGIGVGFTVQSVPLYVSEMAPYKWRGAMNIMFQMTITVGIMVANFLNWIFAKFGAMGWRYSLGGAMVPALIITLGAIVLPDTPNSMIERGLRDEAKRKLQTIRGVINVDQEFNDLVAASEASNRVQHPWRNLRQRKHRPHLVMALLIPFFQQLTGINVIMFYAPVLFNTIGFGSNASLMSALITGIVNVVATSVSIYGADKWGRRALFLEGGVQMLICQLIVAALIGAKFGTSGNPGHLSMLYAMAVVVFICLYVAAFAWSWGPLGWLVPSEIFPLEIRSAAQSINASVNMLFTFVIAEIFLQMLCYLKFGLFLVFAFFVILMTVFIYFFLPETKNIPIEEMAQVWKSHWYWSRFVEDLEVPGVEMEKKNIRNV